MKQRNKVEEEHNRRRSRRRPEITKNGGLWQSPRESQGERERFGNLFFMSPNDRLIYIYLYII